MATNFSDAHLTPSFQPGLDPHRYDSTLEAVEAAKAKRAPTGGGLPENIKRIAAPAKIRSIDEAKRTIEFVASTEAVDRYGDIIRVDGWQLDNYLRNPVFLFAHRSGDPPIGKTVSLRKEFSPPALVQVVEFADAATYPFAETIFRLYQGGFLNAVSVGFLPLKWKQILDEDDKATGGIDFMEQELLELSAVAVPANPEALGRAVTKGVISAEECSAVEKFLCGEDNPPWSYLAPGVTYTDSDENPEAAAAVRERPVAILKQFCDEGRRLAERAQATLDAINEKTDRILAMRDPSLKDENLSRKTVRVRINLLPCPGCGRASGKCVCASGPDIGKTVIPFREEPLAPRDADWDATAEMNATEEPAAWRRMSTVIDGDPELKGSYKLPHHLRPSRDYATVLRGVSAALARFDQTDMPEDDRPGARAHLVRHREEFGEDEEGFDGERFERGLALLEELRNSLAEGQEREAAREVIERYVQNGGFLPKAPGAEVVMTDAERIAFEAEWLPVIIDSLDEVKEKSPRLHTAIFLLREAAEELSAAAEADSDGAATEKPAGEASDANDGGENPYLAALIPPPNPYLSALGALASGEEVLAHDGPARFGQAGAAPAQNIAAPETAEAPATQKAAELLRDLIAGKAEVSAT